VGIDASEVELPGDQEQHGAHGFESAVPTRLALGGLKKGSSPN
jgi:hypothetical protein